MTGNDGGQRAAVEEAMVGVRRAVQEQLGSECPAQAKVVLDELPRFSPDLPTELDPAERECLTAEAEELQPWLQGPFYLGGDLVVGRTWRNDARWLGLGERVPESLADQRVLDVGSNAGYDPFMFHLRGAEHVLACEPFEFIEQARFLERLYRTDIDFQPLGWQELDPEVHGRFDLVHCHGVLYHEAHPMAMLERLRAMVAPDGRLLLGSMMLADPELSEYARFVPGAYYGDRTWWWVPGRLALRWMIEATGFEITGEFGWHDGLPGEFRTSNGYLDAKLAERTSELTSPYGR